MEVLWHHGVGRTVREVDRALAGEPQDRVLAYTTVMTVLDRLAKKGLLQRQRVGWAWRYRPAVTREAYVAEHMLAALSITTDREAALRQFVTLMSGNDVESLRRALDPS